MALETAVPIKDNVLFTWLGTTWEPQNANKQWSLHRARINYFRMEVRNGDIWVRDNLTQRSEVRTYDTFPFNTDIWLSMAMRICSQYPNTDGVVRIDKPHFCWHSQIHSSMHPNPGDITALSPAWAQGIDHDGSYYIVVRSNGNSPITENDPTGNIVLTGVDFPRDEWVNLVHRMRFTNDGSNGQLDAYMNGTQIYSGTPPMGYNQPDAGYIKFGIYRWPVYANASDVSAADAAAGATSAKRWALAEFENVEYGTTDLSARVANPLPVS